MPSAMTLKGGKIKKSKGLTRPYKPVGKVGEKKKKNTGLGGKKKGKKKRNGQAVTHFF